MIQLSFLPQVDKKPTVNVKVKVSMSSNGTWTAAINGGWWIARGKSKSEAVKKVVESFTRGD